MPRYILCLRRSTSVGSSPTSRLWNEFAIAWEPGAVTSAWTASGEESTSPIPTMPSSVWTLMTRSSWLPSAMPSSSAGWRRMMASTSVIFNWAPTGRRSLIVNYTQIVYNRQACAELPRPLLDRPRRAREACGPARAAPVEQHERLVAPLHPDRLDQGRRRADGRRSRRRPRRRAGGTGRRAPSRARDGAVGRAGPADRRAMRLARRLARVHAPLAERRQLQPLLPAVAGRRTGRPP